MLKSIELPFKLALMMLIAALCLGLTNMVTADPIQRQKAIKAEALRIEALPGSGAFDEIEVPNAPDTLIGAYKSDKGCVFEMSAGGFGGPVAVTVGITNDGKIAGVRIGDHSETPGLGANATNESFFGQYAGKLAKQLALVKSSPKDQEIQAITAATITSRAVTNAVNDAIACYEAAKGGL